MAAPFSSGAASTAASPPPSRHGTTAEPFVLQHDWELLPAPNNMSSSMLLSHGHGLGLGLPHRSVTVFPPEDEDARDENSSSTADEAGLLAYSAIDGDSLPLDVSQIAAMCSSTTGVEPFTEGWKPQFRIAGAALQEDHYHPDPLMAASTILERPSSEPFLVMDDTPLEEPSAASAEDPKIEDRDHEMPSPSKKSTETEDLEQEDVSDEKPLMKDDGGDDLLTAHQKMASFECAETGKRKAPHAPGKSAWWNRDTLLCRKSHIVWSVALTATLLGVLLITRRFQADRRDILIDLSTSDEK